ncbi:hypothetical protein FOZ62_002401, partial [Perkinsus olseni]
DGVNYLERVHVFSTAESHLPIACLEAHILYKGFAMVHRLEIAARRRFNKVYYHVDNVAVEVTFSAGRPASFSNKDAKPILLKYLSMTHALFDPLDFNRRIFVERVATQDNPADDLTRNRLLQRFIDFAKNKDLDVTAVSSEPRFDNDDTLPDRLQDCGVLVAAIEDTSPMHPLPSMAEICHQQSIDRNIKQAVSLLTQDGKELIPASIPAVFRLVWSTLLVRHGLLWRHLPAHDPRYITDVVLVPVLPSTLEPVVLNYFHNPVAVFHPGIQRTIRAVKTFCWFPSLARRVCEHIGSCQVCHLQQLRLRWSQGGVQKAAPPSPWHTVAADVLSVSTPTGHRLLLTAVCLFSSWPEVRELSSKSSRNIAEALKSMNSTLGPFKVLKTDRGLEFRGEVDKYIKKIGAVHSISLPYSPVAVIEQLNKTLLQKLQGAFYSPVWSSQSFGSIVDDILWGLRSTPTTVHHMEPFSIMFGRSPHHDRVQDSRQRAQVHENLQDLLSERRSKAMLKANSPITLTPGTVVFVRNHDLDRKYKVGKRWSLMTVLRQEGVKVYLADYGSSPSTSRVLERHVRECLPTPPGFLDKTKKIVLDHSATRSRHGVLPSTRSTSVSQRGSVAKFKVPVRYSLRVKGKTPNAAAGSQSHHAAPQADTTSDTN